VGVAAIVKALKQGKAKDGSGIARPCRRVRWRDGSLTEDDATDIANYIKSHAARREQKSGDMCSFPPMHAGRLAPTRPREDRSPSAGADTGTAGDGFGPTSTVL